MISLPDLKLEIELLQLFEVFVQFIVLAPVVPREEVHGRLLKLFFKLVQKAACFLEAPFLRALPAAQGHLRWHLQVESILTLKLGHGAQLCQTALAREYFWHLASLAVEVKLLAVAENLPILFIRGADQGGDPLGNRELVLSCHDLSQPLRTRTHLLISVSPRPRVALLCVDTSRPNQGSLRRLQTRGARHRDVSDCVRNADRFWRLDQRGDPRMIRFR